MYQLATEVFLSEIPVFMTKKEMKVVSLSYINGNGDEIKNDINSFRPDPRDFLSQKKKYKGVVYFQEQYGPENKYILVLKEINVDNTSFVRIRS